MGFHINIGGSCRKRRRRVRQATAPMIAVIFLLGVLCLGLFMHFASESMKLEKNGVHVEGSVVRIEESVSRQKDKNGNYRDKRMYAPVISFKDAGNADVEFKSSASSSSPSSYTVGEKVPVIYLAEAPLKTAKIYTKMYMWAPAGAMAFFGVLLMWAGVAQSIGLRRTREQPQTGLQDEGMPPQP